MTSRMFRPLPAAWQGNWARVVSDVVSPPMVWAVLILMIGVSFSGQAEGALIYAAILAIAICLVPIVYVFLMVRAGKIGDIHMKERHERHKPLLITVLAALAAWWFLRVQGAPLAFPLLALISVVQVGVIALVTLAWQISMHTMAISSATVATGAIFGLQVAFLLVPLIVLVGAARLKLDRHTPAQVLAGTLVGALVPTLMLLALPSFLDHIL